MSKNKRLLLIVLVLFAIPCLANTSCDESGNTPTVCPTVAVGPTQEPDLADDMLALNGRLSAIACYNDLADETEGNAVAAKCEAYRQAWESATLLCKCRLLTTGTCGGE